MIKDKYLQHRSTIHNIIWRSLQLLGKQGITFLIFILAVRTLLPYEFGIYNYAMGIIFFLIMFGDFGVSLAASKFTAEYSITQKNKVKLIIFNSGIITIIFSSILIIIMLIFGSSYFGEIYVYLLYLLPLTILAPLTSLYDGVYCGLRRFKKLAIITLIVGFISLIGVYLLLRISGIYGVLIAQNIFYALLLFALAINYGKIKFRLDRDLMKGLTKYSIIIGLGSLGLILYSRIDVLFLGHFGYIEEIGYFEIANKFLAVMLVPFSIISQVIAPNITKHFSRKNYGVLRDKFKKYLLLSFMGSLILVIAFLLSYKMIIQSFFKPYATAEVFFILSLMSIVYLSQLTNGIIPNAFAIATGHARLVTLFLITFGVIHLILNYLLITHFGYLGILYSIIITKVITDILFIFTYYKIIKKLK